MQHAKILIHKAQTVTQYAECYAAINQYLLPAGCSAANPLMLLSIDGTDRQMPDCYIDATLHTMRAQSITDVLETESMIRRESKINTNFIQLASPISSMHSLLHADTCILRCPLSEMPPTSHHFRPSLSPVVSLSLGILHEWMRTQMLAKPSSNLLQRTGGDHRGGRARLG